MLFSVISTVFSSIMTFTRVANFGGSFWPKSLCDILLEICVVLPLMLLLFLFDGDLFTCVVSGQVWFLLKFCFVKKVFDFLKTVVFVTLLETLLEILLETLLETLLEVVLEVVFMV